ncbi:uncharacterized protein LOC123431344 [Hordeum vulgare subsp. vulgare]|uniref:DUF6598 domain-containing protein n=1 Tax=Hordeum vulgare subsp. vulgare TaxID=112509 RepID=A0A8I7B4E0_HORVV|nr:uncharacterized protein LOC123431343 [Hordeum vulgare subsp. vulgare]XP_044971093.1 uncharacterized protein LOC123431344 [Hordeum vulgare subsp. vulgare]
MQGTLSTHVDEEKEVLTHEASEVSDEETEVPTPTHEVSEVSDEEKQVLTHEVSEVSDEEKEVLTHEDDEVSEVSDEEKEDKTMISKRQIRKLCEELQGTLDYLRLDIEPAAPLREPTQDGEGIIHTILEQFKDLRRRTNRLSWKLLPFYERYEEEQAKRDSYEGLDEEETARKKMDKEEKLFDSYRQGTEFSSRRVTFTRETTLSPMYFTHCTPGLPLPCNAETEEGISLQVYSFKISEIRHDLRWPLQVYGVVAARDNSDRKRNIIFDRPRHECQELTADDPFLRLTGPSRAIMALSPVDFEVQLKLKGATESECEDRSLMNRREHYTDCPSADCLETLTFENCLCTAELRVEELYGSVQATFVSVRVVRGGPWPFEYGGRIACSSPPHEVVCVDPQGIAQVVDDSSCFQVVLLDSRDFVCGKMPVGKYGYLDLSRRLVSVQLRKENSRQYQDSLKVFFQAYSKSGGITAQAHVKIRPKACNISQHTCDLGGSKLEITIAWSAIVRTDLC